MSGSEAPRASILERVTTPLGYLTLTLLIIDGTITGLTIALPEYRPMLMWLIVISIPSFAAVVVSLAIFLPEALKGDRPLQKEHADQFAGDLFIAFDGPLRNLDEADRMDAWTTAIDIISDNAGGKSTPYSEFRAAIGKKLQSLSHVAKYAIKPRGRIRREPTT